MLRHTVSICLVAATAQPDAVRAETGSDDAANVIVVTGQKDGYHVAETRSGTKTNTPLLDIPQAISVIPSDQIRDQDLRSIADIIRMIPGAAADAGEGHRDQISLRGNNSTADFFIDGLRDDAQYFRSFYNIDRVEALKGPNAMIFGRGGGGGVINRVTKAPINLQLTNGSVDINSFGNWSVKGDVNRPFGSGAFRLNGFYESLNNHRDAFSGSRLGINPVVGMALGDWKLQLAYEFVKDNRVVDRGIPSAFTGTLPAPAGPANVQRSRFFGVVGVNNSRVKAHLLTFHSEAALNDALTFSVQLLYGNYDKIYTNAFPATSLGGTAAAPTVGIEAYRDPTKRQTAIGQANLVWHFKTGGISHILLLGGEVTDQTTQTERINGFFSQTNPTAANRRTAVELIAPLRIPPIYFIAGPLANNNRSVRSKVTQVSAFVQDQIHLLNGIELIGGIRYDRFSSQITNRFTSAQVARADALWSPRLGLVVKPFPQASLYLSTSTSFLPQAGDQFTSFDATFAALEPEKLNNLEAGAKWDILPGLSANLALYRLVRSNSRAPGPTPGTIVLTGEQRSKGIEFSLSGRIIPRWQTSVGFSLTDAKIARTTTAAPAGRSVAKVPRYQFSAWNRAELTNKIGVGLGIYYQSSQFGSISNLSRVPGFTRFDAALFYKFSRRIDVQLNLENLTNIRYFPSAHTDNNIMPGAPFNARIAVNVRL